MKVELLHNTPLEIADLAISKCWDKKSTDGINRERMQRVGVKFKHASTLEHVYYNFDIDGISRACLQELARHRMSSFSVKSSRYTLKELKDAPCMWYDAPKDCDWETGKRFLVMTGENFIDSHNIFTLGSIQNRLLQGLSNDVVKYQLPEAYKTSLVWTINIRSLRNFLALRSSKSALWEIRELAQNIYNELPVEHLFLFEDIMNENE